MISWLPVESSETKNNTDIEGRWEVNELNGVSSVRFKSVITVKLPFSKMVKMVVQPFVKLEFDRLVERYLDNVQAHFASELRPQAALN